MNLSMRRKTAAWRRELARCLPALLGRRLASRFLPPELVIGAEGDGASMRHLGRRLLDTSLERLPQDGALKSFRSRHSLPWTLVVPEGWILRRELVLPKAAEENLRQVVAYEVDRISPFPAGQVFFDVEEAPSPADQERLKVQVELLPRQRVQPWLEALRQAGIPVGRVEVEGGRGGNLLPPEARQSAGILDRAAAALPLLALLLLAGGALALPLWQAKARLEELHAQEKTLGRQAAGVLALRQELEHQLEFIRGVTEQRRTTPDPLAILSALTRLLPDDTYLQSLQVNGSRLVLRGLSAQSSALIGLLESSPLFDHPRFLSPVTRQGEGELFHLGVDYRPPDNGEKTP